MTRSMRLMRSTHSWTTVHSDSDGDSSQPPNTLLLPAAQPPTTHDDSDSTISIPAASTNICKRVCNALNTNRKKKKARQDTTNETGGSSSANLTLTIDERNELALCESLISFISDYLCFPGSNFNSS